MCCSTFCFFYSTYILYQANQLSNFEKRTNISSSRHILIGYLPSTPHNITGLEAEVSRTSQQNLSRKKIH